MPITDLIPWKKDQASVPIRRGREEDTLLDFRNQMNRLFDDFFERPFRLSPFSKEPAFGGGIAPHSFAPHMDVSETNKEVKISAELPGMEPEDISITLDGQTLTISGEKRSETEEKDQHYYRLERSYGSFQRSISLPEGILEDKIDATFKRGVLVIKLPKSVEAQKKSKKISIKTD